MKQERVLVDGHTVGETVFSLYEYLCKK